MPKITVLMAAYNAADYIGQSIDSILGQTFKDFELLIIDDGSTDNTVDIISNQKDQRIRLIQNPQNMGVSYSRNVALKEAQGEYLAIMDSDDIALPQRLEIQIQQFNNREELAAIGASAYVINADGTLTKEIMLPICDTNKLHASLLLYNSFVHSTMMIRLSVFKEMGGYPPYSIGEDYGFFSKIALKYEVNNIPDILLEYRSHGSNISKQKRQELDTVHQHIMSNQLDNLLPTHNLNDIQMMLNPISETKYSIDEYYNLYTNIVTQNRIKKLYPIKELERIIFNKWCSVIVEKGKSNLFGLYLRSPLFNKEFVTFKHVRKIIKKIVRNTFK